MPPKRTGTTAKPSTETRTTRTRVQQVTHIPQTTRITSEKSGTGKLVHASVKRSPLQRITQPVTSNRKTSPTTRRGPQSADTATEQEKSEYDIPVASSEEERAQPVAKPTNRQRPPRMVKKVTQTAAQKAAIERLQRRMEEDVGVKAGNGLPDDHNEIREGLSEEEVEEKEPIIEKVTMQPRSPAVRKVPGNVVRPPHSNLKVHRKSGAETSVLALANFRRRPRQPSLLQMVQQGNLGEDSTDFDFSLGGEEDDFAPHDESTPLQVSKARGIAVADAQRDDHDDDELYAISPRPKSRKRKSDELENPEVQVIRSSPMRSESPASTIEDDPAEHIAATAPEEVQDDVDPDTDAEDEPRQSQSDTFADPLSSSPPPMPQSAPRTTARHRSPAHVPTARTTKTKTLDTATLRALLPKRRTRASDSPRRHSDFDLPVSSDPGMEPSMSDADQDELAMRAQKGTRTTTSRAKPRKQAPKPGALSAVARKASAQTRTTRTSTAPLTKGRRTYGRSQGSSDKENEASTSELSEPVSEAEEGEGQDTSLETVAPKKKQGAAVKSSELDAARKKFEQIDEWEMEFESASLGGGGSSSPWR